MSTPTPLASPGRPVPRRQLIDEFAASIDRTSHRGNEHTPKQVAKTLRRTASALLVGDATRQLLAGIGVDVPLATTAHRLGDLGPEHLAPYRALLEACAPVALSVRDFLTEVPELLRTWRDAGQIVMTQPMADKVVGRTESPALRAIITLCVQAGHLPHSRAELTEIGLRAGLQQALASEAVANLDGGAPKLPRVKDRPRPRGTRSEEVHTAIAENYDAMVHTALSATRDPSDARGLVHEVVADGLRGRFFSEEVSLTRAYLCAAVRLRGRDPRSGDGRGKTTRERPSSAEFDDESGHRELRLALSVPETEYGRIERSASIGPVVDLLVATALGHWRDGRTSPWLHVSDYFESLGRGPHQIASRAELRADAREWAKRDAQGSGKATPRGFYAAIDSVCDEASEELREQWYGGSAKPPSGIGLRGVDNTLSHTRRETHHG